MRHMQNTDVYSYMNVLQCVMYSNWVASWHGKREDHVIKSEP
jgi:hypothetical protein